MANDEINRLVDNNEKWAGVRTRLAADFPASFHPDKTIKLLDLCRASPQLRQLIPFISLGRLGLERFDAYERGLADDFVCLYFYDGRYVASNSGNEEKRFFDTAEATITFVKQHLEVENPFQ
jgi:hypothetical protein